MRLRVQCKNILQFGSTSGPCHKILCEIHGEGVVERDGDLVVRNADKVVFKCSKCGEKKTIIFKKEDLKNAKGC